VSATRELNELARRVRRLPSLRPGAPHFYAEVELIASELEAVATRLGKPKLRLATSSGRALAPEIIHIRGRNGMRRTVMVQRARTRGAFGL
jgi:hypothetical protein